MVSLDRVEMVMDSSWRVMEDTEIVFVGLYFLMKIQQNHCNHMIIYLTFFSPNLSISNIYEIDVLMILYLQQ